MYDKKFQKCDATFLEPRPPLSQTVTPPQTPSLSSMTYFMDSTHEKPEGNDRIYR